MNKSKLDINVLPHIQPMFELFFDQEWEILQQTQSDKLKKVKQQFVKSVSNDIYKQCWEKFARYSTQLPATIVSDIVNYVFHYHFLLTSCLNDADRAFCQKNDQYKADVVKHVLEVVIRKNIYGLKPNSSATVYNPEIYTCDFLCDFFVKKVMSLSLSLSNEDEKLRFTTLQKLFLLAFRYVKSILTLLTHSFPAEAIITWRSLFEIEYTILVLIKYDSILSKYYHKFGEFSFLDEDSDEQAIAEYERFAKKFNQDPYRSGFRNYGWILTIGDQEKPKPNLKSLLRIAKFNEYDHEQRYCAYQDASKFSHSNAVTLNAPYDDYGSYAFVINNLFTSINNLKYAFINFLKQYNLPLEDDQQKEVESLFKKYVKTYKMFEENYRAKLEQTN